MVGDPVFVEDGTEGTYDIPKVISVSMHPG